MFSLFISNSLTKLAGLLIKSLAKPLSKRVKHEFSRYELTQRLLIRIGETNHQLSSRLTIWSAGFTVRSIKPLEQEQAMKQGAEFIGESFLFLVGSGVVLYEYTTSNSKAAAKTEQVNAIAKQERRDLQAKLHALDIRLKALEDVVANQNRGIVNLVAGGPTYKAPDQSEIVPITNKEDDEDDSNKKESKETEVEKEPKDTVDQEVTPQPSSWRKWIPW